MTNDEINRKISEMRVVECVRHSNDTYSEVQSPRDWTGSEEASAVLLEEMPLPHVWKNPNREWACEPDLNAEVIESANERKCAIALAWLKWKGIE